MCLKPQDVNSQLPPRSCYISASEVSDFLLTKGLFNWAAASSPSNCILNLIYLVASSPLDLLSLTRLLPARPQIPSSTQLGHLQFAYNSSPSFRPLPAHH